LLLYARDGQSKQVPAGVKAVEELRVTWSLQGAQSALYSDLPANAKAVSVLTLAQRLCELAGLGDPSAFRHGDIIKYQYLVNALEAVEDNG
jgi:hypothetical protein